ncbi:tight adherence protein B [Kribbella aluminosa]|uniref:Tight adherence protein B n=1 Tax=Kribbella aluminosa TaxID=416017 RepID=A0ABS4US61_9ACTN|nr:type II secretion system protein [Kribbella aluminosa]MBP2354399.1 tight adherence protein B [Kribbella aluminosa]
MGTEFLGTELLGTQPPGAQRPGHQLPARQLTGPQPAQPLSRHLRPRLARPWLLVPPTAAALLSTQALVSTLAITVVLLLAANQRAHHKRQKIITTRRATIIEALDVLSADLTAGRPPIAALEGAASISPDLQPVHAAAKLGADVPTALTRAATTPGATSLRALAAAWRVTEQSGATFAALTERLANSLRADEAIHRQTEASLATARSTARILATLPTAGIALGYALGAHPLTFLTTTAPGYFCLTTGLLLTTAGLHWTTRLSTPQT